MARQKVFIILLLVTMTLMLYYAVMNDKIHQQQHRTQPAGAEVQYQDKSAGAEVQYQDKSAGAEVQYQDQPAGTKTDEWQPDKLNQRPKMDQPPESLLAHPSERTKMELPRFLRDVKPDPSVYNIYQVVTSLPDTLSLRHFCSLESYCLENPGAVVWFLLLDMESIEGNQLRLLEGMMEYPNLKLASLDLNFTVKDTPLEKIISTKQLEQSTYPANHLSDVLRLAVVSKAGGLYTDFDFICLRSVSDVRNSFAQALPNVVMNGLFHFDADNPFLEMVMEEDAINFKPKHWSWNGPLLFTRMLKEYCRGYHFKAPIKPKPDIYDKIHMQLKYFTPDPFPAEDSVNATTIAGIHDRSRAEEVCRGVNLLHTTAFMPLYAGGMKEMFKPGSEDWLHKVPVDSYAVHLFNKITKKTPLVEDSALHFLALRYCPRTHATLHSSNMTL